MFVKSSILLYFYFSYETFMLIEECSCYEFHSEEMKEKDILENIIYMENELKKILSLNDQNLELDIESQKIQIEIYNKEIEISNLRLQNLQIQEHINYLVAIIASFEQTKKHTENTLSLYRFPNSLNLDLFFDEEEKTQYRNSESSLSENLSFLMTNNSRLSSNFQQIKEILIVVSKKDLISKALHELESLKKKLEDIKPQCQS